MIYSGVKVTAEWLEKHIAYAGDGNSLFYVGHRINRHEYYIYNFTNNKIVEYSANTVTPYYLYDILSKIDFKNGVHRVFQQGNVYDIKDDGTINHFVILPEGVSSYTDDYDQYFVNSDGTLFFMAKKDDNIVLMNSKGVVIKDFKSAYGATVTDAFHCGDGKWTLMMKNNEGTYYYCAIDITGTFKFDPIKCDKYDKVRIMSNNNPFEVDGHAIIIDFETGKEIYRYTNRYGVVKYSNGIFYDSYANPKFFVLDNK